MASLAHSPCKRPHHPSLPSTGARPSSFATAMASAFAPLDALALAGVLLSCAAPSCHHRHPAEPPLPPSPCCDGVSCRSWSWPPWQSERAAAEPLLGRPCSERRLGKCRALTSKPMHAARASSKADSMYARAAGPRPAPHCAHIWHPLAACGGGKVQAPVTLEAEGRKTRQSGSLQHSLTRAHAYAHAHTHTHAPARILCLSAFRVLHPERPPDGPRARHGPLRTPLMAGHRRRCCGAPQWPCTGTTLHFTAQGWRGLRQRRLGVTPMIS